jgi:hypothetical protein
VPEQFASTNPPAAEIAPLRACHASSTRAWAVWRRRFVRPATLLFVADLVLGCRGDSTAPASDEICEGYGDWSTSAYVLPYSVGSTYRVIQGNCAAP